jgi:DNA-binding LacI/PurR family transcriptional regulator
METSYVPKYSRVVDFIKSQIRIQKYRVGEILPGQRVLAEQLGLSRPSVKRAIEVLVQEGILECNPSVGSIVKQTPVERLLVGYHVKDLQDPFHVELIRELDIQLHHYRGALVAIQGTDDSRMYELGITHAVKHHEFYRKGRTNRVPTIYTGDVPGPANMVVSDVHSGMVQIYRHLKELGHRQLAYASPFAESEDVQFRHLYEAARGDGVEITRRWRFEVDPHDIDACEEVAGRIRRAAHPPTALICYNDWLAIAVMKAARNQGLDVPGRLSITGYDDLFMSSLLQIPLTTVRFSRRESAENIVEMLLNIDEGEYKTAVVDTKLIIRESTCVPLQSTIANNYISRG